MWLQLSQFLKNFTKGNARKLAVNFTDLVTFRHENRKNTRDLGFARHTSAQLSRAPKTLGSLLKGTIEDLRNNWSEVRSIVPPEPIWEFIGSR